MEHSNKNQPPGPLRDSSDPTPPRLSSPNIRRRDLLKIAVGAGAGLALADVIDLSTVKAAAQQLKLANVSEFTTSCNFCSCGCGMVAAVREGKLITMEGDLRPHSESWLLVRQRHLHVRDTRLAESSEDAALSRSRQRPLGRHLLGRRGAIGSRRRFGRRATRPGSPPRRSTTKRFRSIGRMRSASSAARRTRTRSATSSRRRPGCSAWLTSSTRPDFDTAPRSPVWGPRSGGGR